MIKKIIHPPEVANLVSGIREFGYTIDTAIADIIDNSITAMADSIEIYFDTQDSEPVLAILDNGVGMDNGTFLEAMRPSAKNPNEVREKNDLGRYGLGLKTASFSQSKKLTVMSKTDSNAISIARWDIDEIIKENNWVLSILDESDIDNSTPLFNDFKNSISGTLVLWDGMDKIVGKNDIAELIPGITNHLSLVFHRFILGDRHPCKVKMQINKTLVIGFDPFDKSNSEHKEVETLFVYDKQVKVVPWILPSSKKVSTQKHSDNATFMGYKEAQGCYLYRANRLISYGGWWGIIGRNDSQNLVRIEIDIDNSQDQEWNVSVTKAGFSVKPPTAIRAQLATIFRSAVSTGKGVLGGRIIRKKRETTYWTITRKDEMSRYTLNKSHPLFKEFNDSLSSQQRKGFAILINEIQKYLPVQDIFRKIINEPKSIDQMSFNEIDIDELRSFIEEMRSRGISEDNIKQFAISEGFSEIFGDTNE